MRSHPHPNSWKRSREWRWLHPAEHLTKAERAKRQKDSREQKQLTLNRAQQFEQRAHIDHREVEAEHMKLQCDCGNCEYCESVMYGT